MGWYLNKNCKNNQSGDNQQTKTFCSTVSTFMSENGKHRKTNILRKGDDVIVNTEDICNVFNDCFINDANASTGWQLLGVSNMGSLATTGGE